MDGLPVNPLPTSPLDDPSPPARVAARRNTPPVGLAQVPQTLRGVEESVWELLQHGISDRFSALHTLTLGTVTEDGFPEQRIVVPRALDPASRVLRFNTDLRSPKFGQINANPRVAMTGYDACSKVALRMAGLAMTEVGTDHARTVWDRMRPMSRECYRVGLPPSSPVSSPDESPLQDVSEADAFENFALVHVTLIRIEWLYLRHGGHMRAKLIWSQDAGPGTAPDATWLVA
jgi:pyridoxamine 5'-phosphate oxidase